MYDKRLWMLTYSWSSFVNPQRKSYPWSGKETTCTSDLKNLSWNSFQDKTKNDNSSRMPSIMTGCLSLKSSSCFSFKFLGKREIFRVVVEIFFLFCKKDVDLTWNGHLEASFQSRLSMRDERGSILLSQEENKMYSPRKGDLSKGNRSPVFLKTGHESEKMPWQSV